MGKVYLAIIHHIKILLYDLILKFIKFILKFT